MLQAQELLQLYRADLGLREDIAQFLADTGKQLVSAEHWSEMEALASCLSLTVEDIALCNFYYDAFKVVLGCTAFGVETENGILHARNLDWWTDNGALARNTCICHFKGASAGPFTTVGWPGFIGAFSATAPGRFSITLNAVLSFESPEPAMPVPLLLRTVLETASNFGEALEILRSATIPCDCLLLITGTRSGELAVIERTPTRQAVRFSESGFISVTNDYKVLAVNPADPDSQLLRTSCRRYERLNDLFAERRPSTIETCFSWLGDPGIQMQITVQQMVFNATTSEISVKLPNPPSTSLQLPPA